MHHPLPLRRVEIVACLALSLYVAGSYARFAFNAGALWRDEANSVAMAARPLGETLRSLRYDSFPALTFAGLKLWLAGGEAAASDGGLRFLGFLQGLAVTAAAWAAARWLGARPLLALTALAAWPATATLASIRPYGPGAALALLALGALWRSAGSRRWLAPAVVLAVLSSQCQYQNVLFTAAGAAAAAALGRFRPAWCVLAAGLSLAPYVPAALQTRSSLPGESVGFRLIGRGFFEAFAGPHALLPWLAAALFASAAFLAFRRRREEGGRAPFCLATSALSAGMLIWFLRAAGVTISDRYFVTLFAFIGLCLDGALADRVALRAGAALAAAALVAAGGNQAWKTAGLRQTNVDRVAAVLNERAAAADLVLVSPWYYGVSFRRYYRGAAEWLTLPPMEDVSIHRFDLLKSRMAAPDPMGPVLERIERTLRAGGRVWVAGYLPDYDGAAPPAPLEPAKEGAPARQKPYLKRWGEQARHALNSRAKTGPVDVGPAGNVKGQERLALEVAEP